MPRSITQLNVNDEGQGSWPLGWPDLYGFKGDSRGNANNMGNNVRGKQRYKLTLHTHRFPLLARITNSIVSRSKRHKRQNYKLKYCQAKDGVPRAKRFTIDRVAKKEINSHRFYS
jgi:hypothetical protein